MAPIGLFATLRNRTLNTEVDWTGVVVYVKRMVLIAIHSVLWRLRLFRPLLTGIICLVSFSHLISVCCMVPITTSTTALYIFTSNGNKRPMCTYSMRTSLASDTFDAPVLYLRLGYILLQHVSASGRSRSRRHN